MDLSKAFDCLPHDILLDKLSAYGMSTDSVVFVKSLLPNRKYLKFIWISLQFVNFNPINKNI
jgi:hypothetical protein